MHIAHLARAENELLASALEDKLRFAKTPAACRSKAAASARRSRCVAAARPHPAKFRFSVPRAGNDGRTDRSHPRQPFPEGGEHPLSSYRWVGGSVRLSGDFRGGREP